jgi:hypothetical protein
MIDDKHYEWLLKAFERPLKAFRSLYKIVKQASRVFQGPLRSSNRLSLSK